MLVIFIQKMLGQDEVGLLRHFPRELEMAELVEGRLAEGDVKAVNNGVNVIF